MKKIVLILTLLIFTIQAYSAVTFKEAIAENSKKPMAVLVYTDWAQNYDNALANFRKAQNLFGNTYNYVELDLASNDAKEYTEKYSILPKLPYIMLYRTNGCVQRLIDRNCVSEYNCMISKIKSFIR